MRNLMTSVDWTSVFHDFCTHPDDSQDMISERMGISRASLAKKIVADNWYDKRREFIANSRKITANQASELIKKKNEEHASLGRSLILVAAKQIASGIIPTSPKDIREWLQAGIAIERLALGMDDHKSIGGKFEMSGANGSKMILKWGNNDPVGDSTESASRSS